MAHIKNILDQQDNVIYPVTLAQAVFFGNGKNLEESAFSAPPINYTVSIPASGWTTTAPFTQTVSVVGMLATDTPIVDVVLSSTTTAALQEEKEYAYLSKVATGVDSITLTCLRKKPSIALTLQLKVVR